MMAREELDCTWKLLVVPVWSKSWMIAEKRRAKISRSESQDWKGSFCECLLIQNWRKRCDVQFPC